MDPSFCPPSSTFSIIQLSGPPLNRRRKQASPHAAFLRLLRTTSPQKPAFFSSAAGAGVFRQWQQQSSRIFRVSQASGGKDRHSKVFTSKGLRDRRVHLSISTAIQFYDLQDQLGYDQPIKAIEWLIQTASASIDVLPFRKKILPPASSGGRPAETNGSYNEFRGH